jgi:hypothetical protein
MTVLIKDIQRNAGEIIRIEVSEFKGKELINIRIWYLAGRDSSGNDIYKPTQKGVALNLSEFHELRDGINKLEAFINDKVADTIPEQPVPLIVGDYSDGIPDQETPDDESADDTGDII